jgi:hypothetical protein
MQGLTGVQQAHGEDLEVMWLVNQRGDLELRNVRIPQDRSERLRVVCRSGQLAQPGVVVLVGGDQQRYSPAHPLPPRMSVDVGIDEFSLLPGGGPLQFEGVTVDRHRDPVCPGVAGEPLAHGLDDRGERPTRRAQRDDDRPYGDRVGALRAIRSAPAGAQLADQPLAGFQIQRAPACLPQKTATRSMAGVVTMGRHPSGEPGGPREGPA